MQMDTTISHSGYSSSVGKQSQSDITAGFAVPLNLGEAMDNFAWGHMPRRVAIGNTDEFCSTQEGRDARDSSTCASYHQSSGIQDADQLVDDIHLSHGFIENQEKLRTPGPLAYPFESMKNAGACNSSNAVNSLFETMNYGYEDLPFDASARWDLSKFVTPPEPFGTVIGRNEVQTVQRIGSCPQNKWMMTEEGSLNSNSPGSSRFSNGLSLSLVSSQPSIVHGNSGPEQCSEMSSSGITSYSCSSSNRSLSFNSYKPFQLSPLLSGSRFVHAMQEILAEIASYALETTEQMSYSAAGIESSSCIAGESYSSIDFSDGPYEEDLAFMFQNKLLQEQEVKAKKKHLLALLQVVDNRYNQCLDEIHTVTSAFHVVTELEPNLHARFALPTISFMYKNLRERISSHILAIGAHLMDGQEKTFEARFVEKQWALQQLSKRDHQLWRPQRGLPERSVSVLRAWMFQNFLHPYPKDAEKHLLALRSGLTRNQVSNWFINARVRLWKPMIEEMYAEMNRRKARQNNNDEQTEGNHKNHMCFENTRFTMN